MNEARKTFPALHIDYTVFFLGTEAEQEAGETKEAERAADLEKIIFSADFIALEYTTRQGQRRILHHSTRNGIQFQLSFIDPDGVPAMHESYKAADNEKLLRHFVLAGNEHDLHLRIITKGGTAA